MIVVALVAFVATGCHSRASLSRASHPGIDVVVVVLDTLRPDHLEFYGYERETAPYLASLAREGVVFERAHSASSWTAPATASLVTGLYPTGHGVTEGFFVHRKRRRGLPEADRPELTLNRLPDAVELMSEQFRSAGYRTYGAAANINIGSDIGFDRGFDRYRYSRNATAAEIFDELADWRDEMLESIQPTFLYLHLNDVHSPYERRTPWYQPRKDGRADEIAAYDSQISYVDHELEELARRLTWGEDTLIAVVSDHGEEFGEHGGRLHSGGLHQELTHVLMLFRGPGVPAGRIVTDVSLVDVLPTLLELTGCDDPDTDENTRDGRSLVPLLHRSAGVADARAEALDDRTLFAHRAMKGRHFGRHWWAAVRGGWKLTSDPDGDALFDHQRDFFEQVDRTADEPQRVHDLRTALAAMRARGFNSNGAGHSVPLDAELLRALGELGYIAPDEPTP